MKKKIKKFFINYILPIVFSLIIGVATYLFYGSNTAVIVSVVMWVYYDIYNEISSIKKKIVKGE